MINENIKHLVFASRDFPEELKDREEIRELWQVGTYPTGRKIAIVGSRRMTGYGATVTRQIAYKLASSGITVVSGLALGVDGVAHQAAVEAGGQTIAVLGNGLNSVYPASNRLIAERVVENGCLISQFEPGAGPLKQHFPIRNWLIAALSEAVIITEAAEKSGTLITARHALDLGKEVYAVPGNINAVSSSGTNWLIKMGATPITSIDDLSELFDLKTAKKSHPILKLLEAGPVEEEFLYQMLNMPISKLQTELTLLELEGKLRRSGTQLVLI